MKAKGTAGIRIGEKAPGLCARFFVWRCRCLSGFAAPAAEVAVAHGGLQRVSHPVPILRRQAGEGIEHGRKVPAQDLPGIIPIESPAQTHPWNHFSATTTADAIAFYTEAFADYADKLNPIAPTSQVWQLKEGFECLALVGFVLLILEVASLLIEIPGLSKAKSGELEVQPSVTGASSKFGTFALLLCLILLPAIFFSPLMDDGPGSDLVNVLFYAGCAFGFSGLLGLIFSLKEKQNRKGLLIGSLFVVIAGSALAIVAHTPMYTTGAYWTAPGVNSIAYWTIGCALISLLAMSVVYVVSKAKTGASFKNYGVTFNPLTILMSLVVAILTWSIAYGVLFLVDLLFKADFRIWTFAFKTFDFNIFPAIFRYLPTLSIAAIISRNLYKKTGNIWLPAFLNALLMTTMTIANTMVAFK